MRRREVEARECQGSPAGSGSDAGLVADSDACVCQRVVPIGKMCDGLEQLARARHREARRERGVQPSIGGAVPPLEEVEAFVDRRLCVFLQPLGHLRVEVHHAFADRRAQAASGNRFEDDVGIVHGLHRQHRGRAAGEQLGRRQPRGGAERVRPVRGFHRPHARAQPVHQMEIVGIAAKEGLAEMKMCLDETGKHVAAAGVDHALMRVGDVGGDRRDAAVFDRHVTVEDVEAVVHG